MPASIHRDGDNAGKCNPRQERLEMDMDMERDFMAALSYGKAALKKLSPVGTHFRLYRAELLGERPDEWTVMKVTGADFRHAKSGPNKGKLSVFVTGSQRSAYVTRAEIQACD